MGVVEKEKVMVPKLRFGEFNGDWKTNRLESLFSEFKSGSSITSKDIFDFGDYPVYGGNGIRGYSSSYTHEGEYFLIGRQGALCGNINKVQGKLFISEHAVACRGNSENNTEWLSQRLDYMKLNRLSESSAQPGLSVGKLLRIKLTIPTLPEQQKIAAFLSSVDEKIQQLNRKKKLLDQYKKGVMQQLFSGKLRFKDENGNNYPDWEEKRLHDLADRVTRKNKENNLNVLTISAQLGLVSQLEYFNKSVSAKNVTNYYLLEKGEFAYNKSYSKGYPMGAIKRLKKYEKGVVSTLYICFKFNDTVSLQFMEQYFEFGRQNREIEKVAQEGARNHGLLNIGVTDFLGIDMIIPKIEEQQKIANYLSNIDKKIEQVTQQITQTQTFKKGLLQQMFV